MAVGKSNERSTARLILLFSPLALALSISTLLLTSPPQACADKTPTEFTLTILHTNDLHSHAEPFREKGKVVGGMARIAHLIKKFKKEEKNCLAVDAGDIFQGTPLFTRYKGEVEVELLNRMGYDLYTIGNHEFDEGAINLAEKLKSAKFDILSCNLDAEKLPALKSLLKPSVIKDIDRQKVAFVGAITPDIENLSMRRDGVVLKLAEKNPDSPNYLERNGYIGTIRAEVEKLKKQGINKIILVTHCGLDVDKILGQTIVDVDAIIGGHSHTRMPAPLLIERKQGAPCLIVQTGSYGRTLGKLALTFNSKGEIVPGRSRYRLVEVNDKVGEEENIKTYIDKMAEPLKVLKETVLAEAQGDFDNNWRFYRHDSALGDLIADAFLDAGKEEGVEIAMENRGGIRSRIDRGPITLEKIEELLPFDNHLACANVSGALLMKNLEHSVGGGLGGRFLDVSGLKLAYDLDRPAGHRLVFVLARGKDGRYERVKDDSSQSFRIGMTDYSFNGGEGYDFSGAKAVTYSKEKLNEPLRRFFLANKTVVPQKAARIVPLYGKLNLALENRLDAAFREQPYIEKLPNKKLALFSGTDLGIETIEKGITLPLQNAKMEIPFMPPEQLIEKFKKFKRNDQERKYFCLVLSGQNESPENSQARIKYYAGVPFAAK